MAAPSRPKPRLIVVRHGETEWTLNGRHTGRTDIPLTLRGEEQIKEQAKILVGPGKLIDATNICVALVSPRKRAHRTFHLLFEHQPTTLEHTLTEEVREWDYGDYEGLPPAEINAKNPGWFIYRDGSPGGESVQDITSRVDAIIAKIREYHRQYYEEGKHTRDVLVVCHGHFSRCLIARWLDEPLTFAHKIDVQPGGIVSLGYQHTLQEPAILTLPLFPEVV